MRSEITKEEMLESLVDILKTTQLGREGMLPLGMLNAPYAKECLKELLDNGEIKIIPPSSLDHLINGGLRYGVPGESYPTNINQVQIYRDSPSIGLELFTKLE